MITHIRTLYSEITVQMLYISCAFSNFIPCAMLCVSTVNRDVMIDLVLYQNDLTYH